MLFYLFFDGESICDICFLPSCMISKICISSFLYRAAEVLQSISLSRRQSNTQVTQCTGEPDQHELCIKAVHVNRVIKLIFVTAAPSVLCQHDSYSSCCTCNHSWLSS